MLNIWVFTSQDNFNDPLHFLCIQRFNQRGHRLKLTKRVVRYGGVISLAILTYLYRC